MNDIFGPGGYLKDALPEYEHRKEQPLMADFILERLYDGENGLVEAGTGTGKTIAYLIPALVYSLENQKKISLTTETKTLQKQLINKDLPLVKKIIKNCYDLDFTFSLCLGSANYVCRNRYEQALRRGSLTKGDLKTAENLGRLLEEGRIFSRFDVSVRNEFWYLISREPDACRPHNCSFSSICPFQKSKKEWQKSDLLVMNHYLFFSNIGTGKAYLPHTEIAIFDEAHSIENIASAQLGFSLSRDTILETLDRFYRRKKKKQPGQ